MIWFAGFAFVLVAAAVVLGLYAAWHQTAFAVEMSDEFRQLNADLLRERFGPEGSLPAGKWHRVLSSEEEQIVWAGNGVLLGLRQIALVEDEVGSHWRVVVAHQKNRAPVIEVKQLGAEPSSEGGVKHG